jgi:hypothetical protein
MKHITPNFKPIKIQPKLNIHGKPSKPKILFEALITWPKEQEKRAGSQTKGNRRR